MSEKYFGDEKTFAIRYVPDVTLTDQGRTWYYAFLHLKLGGQIIGTIEETCVADGWLRKLAMLLGKIKNNFDWFKNPEFQNRTDDEIFELVWKSNQSEARFDPRYLYLPQLNNSVWSCCALNLDETIDAYLITVTGFEDQVKFIWKGWRHPCPASEIGKLYSVTVKKELVETIFAECIKYVDNDFKNFKEKVR